MNERALTIGGLARLTRTNPTMIRQYESLGLLPNPARIDQQGNPNEAAHRAYDDNDVRRLTFLRRCRDLGVLNPKLQLLTTLLDHSHLIEQEARDFAQLLYANVQDQLQELVGLEKTLEALLKGEGEKALAVGDSPGTQEFTEKRLRRQLRKPLRVAKSD